MHGMDSAATAPAPAAPQTSGLAIGSLVCGIFGLPTLGLAGVAAVVLGHIGLSQIKKAGGALKGGGMAVTGLVLGYISVLILPIAALAGLAAPMILRQRDAAERTEMITSMKQIGLALLEFDQEFGSFPSDDTGADLEAATGTGLPITGSDVFNQLEAYGVSMQPLLTVGPRTEGDWTYFPGHTTWSDPAEVILISPEIRDSAMILRIDGSIQRVPVARADTLRAAPGAVTVPAPRR